MTTPGSNQIPPPASGSNPATDQSKPDSASATQLSHLRDQIEVLKAEVEKAELEKRLTELKSPREPAVSVSIWERPGLLALFVGVLSAVPATVTAVHGLFATRLATKVRAVELSQENTRLKNEAIKQALDADLSLAHRFRALRYLKTPTEDIENWATKELEIAESHRETVISEFERQIDKLADELEQLMNSGADAATIQAKKDEINNLVMQKWTASASSQAHNQPIPEPSPEQG